MTKETLKQKIRDAFAPNLYPGDTRLKNSNEGDEPFLLEEEFRGKTDWTTLEPEFLDRAPDGFASALSFFSDEAFRFYLPAYLLADLDGKLESATPVFHLTHGLDAASKTQRINPRRYGDRRWFDYATTRFASFTREEVRAIVAYLRFQLERADLRLEQDSISQALQNYWESRQRQAPPRVSQDG